MASRRPRSRLRMTHLLGLAARNVMRNTARSILSLAAIAAGVAGLMLSGGFVNDLVFQLGEALIHSQSGHVQIGRTGYFESGSRAPGRYLITPEDTAQLAAHELPNVVETTRRIGFSGLLGNGRSTYPIVGEGIEPNKEAKLGTYMVLAEGRTLTSGDRYGALVGAGVARAMGLKTGSSFNVVAPTVDEAMNTVDLEVVGVFQSFSKDYDDRTIKVSLQTAQELIDTQGVNVLVLLLDETRHTARVARSLESNAQALKLEVKTWDWLNDFYWKAVALYDRQFGVLRLIVLLMVVLAVAGAINVAVLERAGEFGTMRALGNRSADVVRLVLVEGALMGVLGAVLGLFIGWAAAWGLSTLGIPMPPPPNSNLDYVARIRLYPALVISAAGIGIVATVAASAIPAIRVARIPIADALRRLV